MNDKIYVALTQNELMIIGNILNEALGGAQPIAAKEFHTLIGATRDEAQELRKKLLTEYRENFPHAPLT